MNHYMLGHLAKNRESDKFRGFSYRKTLVDSTRTFVRKNTPSKVINWGIYYQDEHLATVKTLKEVNKYIYDKVNT